MDNPQNVTGSPTTDSDTESLELAQVYGSSGSSRGLVSSIHRPHRPVFDRSANGTVVSPVDGTNQPLRVPALVPNIRLSNFGAALPSQNPISKPKVTEVGVTAVTREELPPRDLKEALKFSLKLCDGQTSIKEVSEDKKEVFNAVMGSYIGNCRSIIQMAIEDLQDENFIDGDIERVDDCLAEVEFDVEVTERANEFCRRKGMEIMAMSFKWKNERHRIRALNIIAGVVQNNPVGIEEANRVGLLNYLIKDIIYISLGDDPAVPSIIKGEVGVGTLYATSCLLRGNPEGCHTFKKANGFCLLLNLLSFNKNPKILKKCFHILSSLIVDETERGIVETSVLQNENWIRYFDLVAERLGQMSDEVSTAVILAQSLEILCRHYQEHSPNLKIKCLSKDDGVALSLRTYLDKFDNPDEFDASSDEMDLVKACKLLQNFIEYTDDVTSTASFQKRLPELLNVVNIND